MKKNILPLFIALTTLAFTGAVKPVLQHKLHISDPSDIALLPNHHLLIASDDGRLYETTADGQNLRYINLGFDAEGVCLVNDTAWVVDESTREVYAIHTGTFKKIRTVPLSYGGGRNAGFEGITFNPENRHFYLLTEKKPVALLEYNEAWQLISSQELHGIRDASSIYWYNRQLYVLSDEDHCIVTIDTEGNTHAVGKLPIYNPEGLAITADSAYVVSDDMNALYIFLTRDIFTHEK